MKFIAALMLSIFALGANLLMASSLTVDGVTYDDVRLVKEFPKSIHIRHAKGSAFIDRSKLTPADLQSLTNTTPPTPTAQATPGVPAQTSKRPIPERLEKPLSEVSEAERNFLEACLQADVQKIRALLQENPELAKSAARATTISVSEDGSGSDIPSEENGLLLLVWAPESPQRLEAMKALADGGVDFQASTSPPGSGSARNALTLPTRLTPEEIDFLLSRGVDPNFPWCVKRELPLEQLADRFNFKGLTDVGRERLRRIVEVYIDHGVEIEPPVAEKLATDPVVSQMLSSGRKP